MAILAFILRLKLRVFRKIPSVRSGSETVIGPSIVRVVLNVCFESDSRHRIAFVLPHSAPKMPLFEQFPDFKSKRGSTLQGQVLKLN